MGVNRTNTDQFQLRLPPGLRERIKAYADLQGRSMNAEIVRILEREFPEPEGIERRISDVLGLVEVLKASAASREKFDELTGALIRTVKDIADGTVQGVDEDVRQAVGERLNSWEEDFAADEQQDGTEGLDQIEIEALVQGRSTAKYPLDREWRSYARSFGDRDVPEAEEDAYRRGFERAVELSEEWRRRDEARNTADLDEADRSL